MENAEPINGGNSTEVPGRRHFENQVEALQATAEEDIHLHFRP
jgi:hypothetical protein